MSHSFLSGKNCGDGHYQPNTQPSAWNAGWREPARGPRPQGVTAEGPSWALPHAGPCQAGHHWQLPHAPLHKGEDVNTTAKGFKDWGCQSVYLLQVHSDGTIQWVNQGSCPPGGAPHHCSLFLYCAATRVHWFAIVIHLTTTNVVNSPVILKDVYWATVALPVQGPVNPWIKYPNTTSAKAGSRRVMDNR